MGRGRKYNKDLPKGVYQLPSGTYIYRGWERENGELKFTAYGSCGTPEEAEYKRLLDTQGHHWVGIEHNPEEYFGFIYCITHKKSGKMYIGKKQYRLWNGPTGGYKCTNPTDWWFEESLWRPNDWKEYTGSCKPLNAEIARGNVWDYEYKVLGLAEDRLDLHLMEVLEQKDRDVLEALDSDGNYLYYNGNIANMVFRAPFLKADVLKQLDKTYGDITVYYNKPRTCRVCQSVIPFPGDGGCTVCDS